METCLVGKTVLNIQGTDAEVMDQLREVATSDKKSESTRNWGCLTMFLAVAAVAGPAMMNKYMPNWALGVAAAIGLVGLVMTVVGSSGDVDDSRYLALQRLHRFLVGDCDRNTQYHYVLDLRPYTNRAFFSHADKFGSMFSLPKGKHEHFDCPVIYGQVRLRDGTMLSVNVNRLTRKTTRTKRGYSGKVKTKVKHKYAATYSLKAKLPQGAPPVPGQAHSPEPGRPSGKPTKFKGQGNKMAASKTVKNVGNDLEIEGLLQLLTFTFRQAQQTGQSSA